MMKKIFSVFAILLAIVLSCVACVKTDIPTPNALGEEINGEQLVDAETGLVIRLKKSFTAKLKQSDERVKGYYSDIKNELSSYKKVNSNVSWHGDRFNFGRDTIAKVNICGKTLCFYLALDPEDPELKSTVYHQKDVGNQKAYESTPFMVKIKSDAAAKKALRLVGYLAEKLGTEKIENFENVLEYKQDNELIYYYLAEAYQANDEIDKAISNFLKSIATNSKFTLAYKKVAILFMARGDYADAIEYLEDYLNFDIPQEEKDGVNKLIDSIKSKVNG